MVFKEKVKCPHGGTSKCIRPLHCTHAEWHEHNPAYNGSVCDGNGLRQKGCKCVSNRVQLITQLKNNLEDNLFEI